MINVGIIGATGYAGVELARLLSAHGQVRLAAVSSVSFEGKPIAQVYPGLSGILPETLTTEDEVIAASDVVFACLPHGLSESIAKKTAAKQKLLIDLGADFRLRDPGAYRQWYGLSYEEPSLHENAVYCIPELHREDLKAAMQRELRVIANPGCYPTGAALAAAPALKNRLVFSDHIVIDAKSGVTGAGRGLTLNTHYPEANEAFGAYKLASHRHTPEIEQTLSEQCGSAVTVTFSPHLLPVNRGILSTVYMRRAAGTPEELYEAYVSFYREEPFVRVMPPGEHANIKNIRSSNYCDISLHCDERTGTVVVCSAIDNMVKGAAGQAIQNMNIVLGFREGCGIDMAPALF